MPVACCNKYLSHVFPEPCVYACEFNQIFAVVIRQETRNFNYLYNL